MQTRLRFLAYGFIVTAIAVSSTSADTSTPVKPNPWVAAVGTEIYSKGTAHDPHFDDAILWPEADGKPAYKKETWPAARVLVWARAELFKGDPNDSKNWDKSDPQDPENWLENGKPATAPPDRNTDVVFPRSEKQYVNFSGDKALFECRHLTVEDNARIEYVMWIHGNLWIKKGGQTHMFRKGEFRGRKHSFARNDNMGAPLAVQHRGGNQLETAGNGSWYPGPTPPPADYNPDFKQNIPLISQYIFVTKPNASVECVGAWGTPDRFHVDSGTLIIGPDSYLCGGNRATLQVSREGTLQLQSGATVSRYCAPVFTTDLTVKGTIQAGSADRPIKRDCYVALPLKDHFGIYTPYQPQEGTFNGIYRLGMLVEETGKLQVFSTDPTTARLCFIWSQNERLGGEYAHAKFKGDPGYDDYVKSRSILRDGILPRRITIRFLANQQLDGVFFDSVGLGGIQLADVANWKTWKHVYFGSNNSGPPEELFYPLADLSKIINVNYSVRFFPPPSLAAKESPVTVKIGTTILAKQAEIRYTLDGSAPTMDSPRYEKPITVTQPTVVTAITFIDGKPMGQAAASRYLLPAETPTTK